MGYEISGIWRPVVTSTGCNRNREKELAESRSQVSIGITITTRCFANDFEGELSSTRKHQRSPLPLLYFKKTHSLLYWCTLPTQFDLWHFPFSYHPIPLFDHSVQLLWLYFSLVWALCTVTAMRNSGMKLWSNTKHMIERLRGATAFLVREIESLSFQLRPEHTLSPHGRQMALAPPWKIRLSCCRDMLVLLSGT